MKKTIVALVMITVSLTAHAENENTENQRIQAKNVCTFQAAFAARIVEYKNNEVYLADVYSVATEFSETTAPLLFMDREKIKEPERLEEYDNLLSSAEEKLEAVYRTIAKNYYTVKSYRKFKGNEYSDYVFAKCSDNFGI